MDHKRTPEFRRMPNMLIKQIWITIKMEDKHMILKALKLCLGLLISTNNWNLFHCGQSPPQKGSGDNKVTEMDKLSKKLGMSTSHD